MKSWKPANSFLESFGLGVNRNKTTEIVSIIGAGGKTSLLFSLAQEAKGQGKRVLITTTTHMWLPQKGQYDVMSLSGDYVFRNNSTKYQGFICVGGRVAANPKKITIGDLEKLEAVTADFDLVLIEADGAAGKSLKAWKKDEPVIPHFTTHTIGVLDISSVGKEINSETIHRVELYRQIVDSETDRVTVSQLQRLIGHPCGLFHSSSGKKTVYLNKIESKLDFQYAKDLKDSFPDLNVVGGSILNNNVYV